VYYYLAESLLKTNRKAEALPYYERLLEEFQVSEYLDEARERVAELKVDQATARDRSRARRSGGAVTAARPCRRRARAPRRCRPLSG
jgi:hypothetical protein